MIAGFIFVLVVSILLAGSQSLPVSQNINSLSIPELNQYRDCVRLGLGSGQYLAVAGEHGVPQGLCPHGSIKFLPWHRYHLASWQTKLNCSIPYWDWARDPIPNAFLEDSYTDADGHTWPNPLKVGLQPHSSHKTRLVGREFPQAELRAGQDLALSRPDLAAFSSALEDAHNLVHVTVGGDMSDIDYASYDPIFYSHHKNVDRLWFLWQTSPSRNSSWSAPLAQDYVQTGSGPVSSLQIANDLSAWMPLSSPSAQMDLDTSAITTSERENSKTSSASSSTSGSVTPAVIAVVDAAGTPTSASSGAFMMPGAGTPTVSLPTPPGVIADSVRTTSASSSSGSPVAPIIISPESMATTTNTQTTPQLSIWDSRLIDVTSSLDDVRSMQAWPDHVPVSGTGIASSQWSPVMPSAARAISTTPMMTSSPSLERRSSPSWHVLLTIPAVKSTVLGYRLEIFMVGQRIGQVGLLGLGRQTSAAMHMSYVKDRLLDVTCHLPSSSNLTSAHDLIRFELLDDQDRLIARPRLNFTLSTEYF